MPGKSGCSGNSGDDAGCGGCSSNSQGDSWCCDKLHYIKTKEATKSKKRDKSMKTLETRTDD